MASIQCTACQQTINKKAKICPHCGAKIPKKTSKLTQCVTALIIAAVGFMMYDQATLTPEKRAQRAQAQQLQAEQQKIAAAQVREKRDEQRCIDAVTAFSTAKTYIKKTLKAPSTAKFPRYNKAITTYLGDCTHKITSYVDADNAFGANIRTHYTATVKNIKGSEQWMLMDIKM